MFNSDVQMVKGAKRNMNFGLIFFKCFCFPVGLFLGKLSLLLW